MTAGILERISPAATLPSPASSEAGASVTVLVVEGGQLPRYEVEWWELAAAAFVPNPFYEPWMLLPALAALPEQDSIRFLMVFGPAGKNGAQPLWGLFPLEIQRRCLHLPIRALALWQHRWCYLTAPLLHASHVPEVLEAFWLWFDRNPLHCHILDTNWLPADGPFLTAWTMSALGRTSLMLNDFPRAFLKPGATAAAYIGKSISNRSRHELKRVVRRLSELGNVKYRVVENVSQVDKWLDEFFRLEERGWKGGQTGGAYAKQKQDMAYVRETTRAGFLRRRMMLLSLDLDGKRIAMKYNILAGDGGFTIRIAYDEAFAKYSPGVLLELENIRRVCEGTQIKWLDSCAEPRHVMADRIWSERRMIRRTLLADASRWGGFCVSSLPLFRWVRRQMKGRNVPVHLQISTRLKNV